MMLLGGLDSFILTSRTHSINPNYPLQYVCHVKINISNSNIHTPESIVSGYIYF